MTRKTTAKPKTETETPAEVEELETFDDPPRRVEDVVVEKRTLTEKSLTVVWSNGWSYLIPSRDLEAHFRVGTHVTVETLNFSEIVGLKVAGVWVWRKSDQLRARERREFFEARKAANAAELEEHREEWAERTAALPEWLRGRLQHLIDDPEQGDIFQRDLWGYELLASELAAIYAEHGQSDDAPEVHAFAMKHSTSGLQHGWAKAAAVRHLADTDPAA